MAWDDPGRHHAAGLAAITRGDGTTLLLGALGGDVPRVSADDDTLAGWYETSPAPWFVACGSEEEVFGAYADALSRHRSLARPRNSTGPVWCSWYSYYEDISESQMHSDLGDLRGLPFDVVQIDHGWAADVGDWQPNAKFPSGMDALAARIAEAGFVPGLWLAPFIALPTSRILRERPHLFLRDRDGELVTAGNWDGPYHALDLTLPEALDHLTTMISTAVGWGYRYLKLDFLFSAAVVAERHKEIGREQAYREAISMIRSVAGDDVYLLGCGAPVLPSLGVFDGLRIGPDVNAFWRNYNAPNDDPSDARGETSFLNSLNRLWLRPLIDLDPDVVYFRTRENLLTTKERQLLRDLAEVCNFLATSDPPSWLLPDELDLMTSYLTRQPSIRQLGRYRFAIGSREVDFAPHVAASPVWGR
ncbi:alpha-galactosidase [Planomonospora venezuelensis]|uniref:Alpha-galactosidase n=1 Tax=Planomonospora venezuelensis TaxID=1999 RepID=A0A841DES0_PLAVE|nr:alpha-galactosidase [Planomonospora venezuelensis]